jgi:3-polyprenyl-4-hydroxybenzoate decarboxylase
VLVQDVEIESLLTEAGYQFMPASGRYEALDAVDDDVDYPTEDIADQLGIPIDDLIRWEEQQVEAADASEG